MAIRVVYTDPGSGRFISAGDAQEAESALRRVYDSGKLVEEEILSFGSLTEDLTQNAEPNWTFEPTRWGGKFDAGDDLINFSALQDAEFPEGMGSFRVLYDVQGNDSYPGRIASTETLDASSWPPDLNMIEGVAPTGIRYIVFKAGNLGT